MSIAALSVSDEPNRIELWRCRFVIANRTRTYSNCFVFLLKARNQGQIHKKSLFTEWMDKTLSTRRAKIGRLIKQAESKLKRFVVDEIKFDRNVLRTLTKNSKNNWKVRISSSAVRREKFSLNYVNEFQKLQYIHTSTIWRCNKNQYFLLKII